VIAMVGRNFGACATIEYAKRALSQGLTANPHAAVTENATWSVEENYRRPLLLIDMTFDFGKPALASAVTKHHILQFTLSPFVTHRAVERVVREQKFEH
jgi:hypothetical protein